jgi:DNA polymerase-3 subunit beta
VLIPTVPFRAAVTACAKVASDRTAAIALRFYGDTLVVSAQNPEIGEAKSEPIDVVKVGTDITIGFNARYLIGGLATVESDTVTVRLSGDLDPAVMVDGDLTVVVMPCRL